MSKAQRNITLSVEVDLALKSKPDFNVSKFCDEALRKALDIKDINIPKEEKELNISIAEGRIKLQMMEKKLSELADARKKEAEKWSDVK